MYYLFGRNSQLSIHNKLMLYPQLLKSVWTDGIQLWECTVKTTTCRQTLEVMMGTHFKNIHVLYQNLKFK